MRDRAPHRLALVSILALFALVAPIPTSDAAPARKLGAGSDLRIVFLEADDRAPVRQGMADALMDVGRIVGGRCRGAACFRTVVQRKFRMRVDGSSTARFVRVRAFVQQNSPGQRVYVDGRLLTSSPQLIGGEVPLRVPVSHTLEIEVAASEPAGLLAHTIVWLVEEAR